MYNTTPPSTDDLPSSRTLLRSTIIAVAAAVVLLLAVVLPAEYGVDPTGIGEVMGLTEMGEIKMQLAREAAVADSIEAALARWDYGHSGRVRCGRRGARARCARAYRGPRDTAACPLERDFPGSR